MTYDEQALRDRLEDVARTAPPVGFGPADLVRRGRRRRQQRQGAILVAAVAAVALVVAVPAVALRGGGTPATGGPGGTAPAAVPLTPGRAPGPIPGFTAAQVRAIDLGCGEAYGGEIGHVNPTPEPGETQGPLVRDAVRTYNVVRDGDGSLHVLLYGPGTALACDRQDGVFNAGGYSGGDPVSLQWLPGKTSIDLESGDRTSVTVAGRVTSGIVQVQVTAGGRSQRVEPVNGTYLVRLPRAGDQGSVQVVGYGRDGRPVEARTQGDIECYTDPHGTVVIQGSDRTTGCRPATPWR
jgi:hypothetical protein